MKVPLIDLAAQYATIRDDIAAAIERVLASQHFILGPEVAGFEREIAAFCGVRHAIGVSSGTDALLVSLMALDVSAGDEVITTPFSFFATAGVISRLGARPVFADIEPRSYNLDPAAIEAVITERTRAILPVHLYGRCADMVAIGAIAGRHGVPVVEDAAQAIGATDEAGRQAGTLGTCACFSFFPTKNLGAFGDAGMVTTDDDALAERIRLLRVHGGERRYYHRMVGGNFRIDALQAAVLRAKLNHLADWNAARRRNAERYAVLFERARLTDRVSLPHDVPGHSYHQYVIRIPRRDEVRERLAARGVTTGVYYPLPLHLQECFSDLGYAAGSLPVAEAAAAHVLALPIHPELTEEQQNHVVNSIATVLEA